MFLCYRPRMLSGLVRPSLLFCLVDVIRVPAHHLLLAHPSLKLRKRHL